MKKKAATSVTPNRGADEGTSPARHVEQLCVSGEIEQALAVIDGRFRYLNAHEPDTEWCLCPRCLNPQRFTMTQEDTTFVLDCAVAAEKVLFYWLPEALIYQRVDIRRGVSRRIKQNTSGFRYLGTRRRTVATWMLRG